MEDSREQQERAVEAAEQEERAAREALESAMRPGDADEPIVRAYRDRWHEASRRLVDALEALKGSRR